VLIEAGRAGGVAIGLLAVAGDGHQHRRAHPRLGAQALRQLVAVKVGRADVEQAHVRLHRRRA
jgi:hypothetical protein